MRSVWLWAKRCARGYRRGMPRTPDRGIRPLPRPANLALYEGLWVAVLDEEVVAAEPTSHRLALKLHGMDHRKRSRVSVEFVRPASDSYIVGLG